MNLSNLTDQQLIDKLTALLDERDIIYYPFNEITKDYLNRIEDIQVEICKRKKNLRSLHARLIPMMIVSPYKTTPVTAIEHLKPSDPGFISGFDTFPIGTNIKEAGRIIKEFRKWQKHKPRLLDHERNTLSTF